MAYNTEAPRVEYVASSGQTIFSFLFKVFETSDIQFYLTPVGQDPDDATDLLTLTTDYTVSINGDSGGAATLVVAATAGDLVTLVRALPTERDVEYQTNGDLLAETLNEDQNYQTYLIADSNESLGRYLTLPQNAQGVDNTLPQPIAFEFMQWNATATALQNVSSLQADGLLWTAGEVYTKAEQDLIDGAQDTEIALKANITDVVNKSNEDQIKLGSLTVGESVSVTNWEYVTTTVTIDVASHNSKVGDTNYVSGLVADIGDAPNGTQTVSAVTATSISYVVAVAPTATPDTGTTVSSALVEYGEIKSLARPVTKIVQGTAVSVAGTSIDFTGIPPWTKKITVMFDGVTTSGTSEQEIRIGTTSGIEASGYVSSSAILSNGSANIVASSVVGFNVNNTLTATDYISGLITISLLDLYTWSASGSLGMNTTRLVTSAGSKTLSGILDRIRLTTANGTDTFTAGTLNIMYEG